VKTACGGVAGVVDAVVVSGALSSEGTVSVKLWVLAELSWTVIDLGLPVIVLRLFSSFNTDNDFSALCIGRFALVKIGRGGEVC